MIDEADLVQYIATHRAADLDGYVGSKNPKSEEDARALFVAARALADDLVARGVIVRVRTLDFFWYSLPEADKK